MSAPAPPVHVHSPTRLRLLAVVVTALWSSSWVLIRSGLDEVEAPLTFAGLRYGLAAVALTCWRMRRRGDRPARRVGRVACRPARPRSRATLRVSSVRLIGAVPRERSLRGPSSMVSAEAYDRGAETFLNR